MTCRFNLRAIGDCKHLTGKPKPTKYLIMEKERNNDEQPETTIPADGGNPQAMQEARERAASMSSAASQIVANAMSENPEAFVAAYKQTGGQ